MTNLRPLTKSLAEQARQELNEDPQRVPSDIEALKKWLSKQPHIIARTDDQFLVSFLRGCKFSLERAKERLDMYFTIRTVIPEFFVIRDPASKQFKDLFNIGLIVPLPIPQTDGSRIVLTKFAYDPHKNHLTDYIDISLMVSDQLLCSDDHAVICGETIIVDISDLSLAHIAQGVPSLLKKIGTAVKEAYPSRQKGVHFIKPPIGFEATFKIFQSFLSEKLTKRLFVHSNLDTLHKHVAKSLLPAEYGGDLESLNTIIDNYYRDELLENRQWFLDDAKYKTMESKRPGKPKSSETLFGSDGSFRKLEVD